MRCRHMYRRPAGGHHHHHHHLHHHSIYQHLAAAALPPSSALEATAHHHPCMLSSPCGCATGGESVNNTSFTQLISSPCQHSDSRYWSTQMPPPAAAVAGNVPDDGTTATNRRGTLSATLRNWVNSNINWFQQPQAGPEHQNNIQTISRYYHAK